MEFKPAPNLPSGEFSAHTSTYRHLIAAYTAKLALHNRLPRAYPTTLAEAQQLQGDDIGGSPEAVAEIPAVVEL